MSIKKVLSILPILSLPLLAEYTLPSSLIDIPTACTRPQNTLRGVFSFSSALKQDTLYPTEWDLGIEYAPTDQIDLTLTMYTPEDYSLGILYQVFPETKNPALAIGIAELSYERHISQVGGGYEECGNPKGWPFDVDYYSLQGLKPSENLSIFAVTSKSIGEYLRLHLGLGRGRFVGYGPRSRYFNTDILFGKDGPKHELAFGLFGGLQLQPIPQLWLGFEFDGRDINTGLSFSISYLTLYFSFVKIEGLLWEEPQEIPRFSLGIALRNLPDTGSIKGIVYDEVTKEPIKATLSILNTPLPPLSTNSSGEYEFKRVPAKKLKILVEKEGYLPREFILRVKPGKRMLADLPLRRAL